MPKEMVTLSSTNRGYDRHASDYYITPIHRIEEFIEEFDKHEQVFNQRERERVILDCCAGGDSTNPMSYPTALINKGVDKDSIKTIDIREDSQAETIGDFLKMELDYKPNVIITNPPFVLAEEIIKKSFELVEDDGWVIMLLRLNYFEGKKRFEGLWRDVGLPKYTFVYHKRLSFTADGRADSVAYAHFVWKKSEKPEFTKLKVI